MKRQWGILAYVYAIASLFISLSIEAPPARETVSTAQPIVESKTVKPEVKVADSAADDSTTAESTSGTLTDSEISIPEEDAPLTEEDLAIDMDFPKPLGIVRMYPFTEKDVSGLKVYMPGKGKQLKLGPLTIDQGELRMVNDKMLYSARGTIFGASARVGVRDYAQGAPTAKGKTFTRVRFGFDFTSKIPTLEIIPGKKATVQSIDLVVEKTKPVEIIVASTILNQPTFITFIVTRESTDVILEVANVTLASIVPQFENTPLARVQIATAKVTINNFTAKKGSTKKRSYKIEGKANLSGVQGLEQSSKDVREVNFVATNDDTGSSFQADAASVSLPVLGTITNAKILGEFGKGKRKLTLEGTGSFSFPGIGSFTATLVAALGPKGIEATGTLQQTLTVAGMSIQNASIQYSSERKTFTIAGKGNVRGHQADMTLAIDAKGGVRVQAQLDQKELKPFGDTPIPVVKDIELRNPGFKFAKHGDTLEAVMTGEVTLFGVPLQSELLVRRSPQGQPVTLLVAAAPAHWKLSQGIPAMRGTLFDDIELLELQFIVCSNDFVDTERQVTYRAGFNFVSKTRLTGPLVPVGQFTGTSPESLITLGGYLAPNPLDSVFKASIPNGVVIKKDNVALGKLELEIAGNPMPSFALLTTLLVKPSAEDEQLQLTSRITFRPPDAALAGTMQGLWHKPLGINGLDLSDLAAEITFNLVAFAATGLPSNIGLAATLGLGSRHVSMAVKLPIVGSSDLVLAGALDELTIADLADVAARMVGQRVPIEKIPSVGMKDLKIYIVPKSTTIGELSFDRGLTLRTAFFLPGFKAFGGLNVSAMGILGEAFCTDINWGPLKVTRSSHDTRPADAEVGPVMRLAVTLEKQEILLSGLIKIGDIIEQDSYLKMTLGGIEFAFDAGLGKTIYHGHPLLEAHIVGKSSGSLTSPQFNLLVDFKDNTRKFVLEQAHDALSQAKDKIKEEFNAAIKEVERLRQTEKEGQEQITRAKEDVNKAREKLASIDRAIAEAQGKIQEKQNEVNSLQRQIDDLNHKIQEAKDWCDDARWYEKAYVCPAAGAKIAGYGTALSAVYAAKKTADGILEAAKQIATGTLQASRFAAQSALTVGEQFLETVARRVTTASLAVARETGSGFLKGVRVISTGTLAAVELALNQALASSAVENIHFEGDLVSLARGKLTNTEITFRVLGQPIRLKFDLDVRNPLDSIKSVANSFVDSVKDIVKNVPSI